MDHQLPIDRFSLVEPVDSGWVQCPYRQPLTLKGRQDQALSKAATGQPQASEYKKNNQQTEHELTAECNLHVTIEEDET